MKFKSVEISAFRIYDQPADATFDFTLDGKEPANFVSIYAPNGFGKTSFYDAVEWGMTKNIQRFWQKKELTEKAIFTLNQIDKEQVKLLRNTNSDKQTLSFVTIKTDREDLEPRFLAPHGNSHSDIGRRDDSENKEFQQVILSQEWISAFLKEVDGGRRYELFIENPALKGVDEYYRNVKGLVSANEEKIRALEGQIDEEQNKILALESGNVLDNVNRLIDDLKGFQESIELVSFQSTEKDILEFKNIISARMVTLERIIADAEERKTKIRDAQSGNGSLAGVNVYFDQLAACSELEKELASVGVLLNKFLERQQLVSQKNNLLGQRQRDNDTIKLLDDILSSFSRYEAILDLALSVGGQLSTLGTETVMGKQKLDNHVQKIAELKAGVEEINNQSLALIRQITVLPEQEKKQQEHLTRMGVLLSEIEAKFLQLGAINLQIQAKQGLNAAYREILDDLVNAKYERIGLDYELDLGSILTSLRITINEREAVSVKLKALDTELARQNSFNNDLEEFINAGLELISKNQPPDCPFCQQTYQSYEELSLRVTSNPLLDGLLQNLLGQRAGLSNELNACETKISGFTNELTTYFRDLLKGGLGELEALLSRQILLSKELETLQAENVQINERLKEVNELLGGRSAENQAIYLHEQLKSLEGKKAARQKQIDAAEILANELRQSISASTARIEPLTKQLEEAGRNPDYLKVQAWANENFPNVPPSREQVEHLRMAAGERIKNASSDINEIDRSLIKLDLELISVTEADLKVRESELTGRKDNLLKSIEAYRNFLSQNLGLAIDPETTALLLTEKLEDMLVELEKAKVAVRDKNDKYQLLSNYQTNILPFLQSEKARSEAAKMEKELGVLKEQVQPLLEEEKRSVRNFLELRIRTFFYTGLINQIYNKIDPHPDFKEVEFVANFDSDNPVLDVLVTNSGNTKRAIPNLYFSSAQINILSLSIFLASALNSKLYDCIFIDDPIQSMDSINVLSLIDLLRSIVVNQDKQIILSTHDQNFYNLLKKKIPSGLFKSKYLQLESFGKVKVDQMAGA